MPDISAGIAATRRRARITTESSLVDRCAIVRPTAATLDEDTAILEAGTPTAVYSGCCRFRTVPTAQTSGTRNRLDASLTVTDYELLVPITAGPFAIGDTITITSLGDRCLTAPSGSWRVIDVPFSKWQIAQHLLVEQVVDRA